MMPDTVHSPHTNVPSPAHNVVQANTAATSTPLPSPLPPPAPCLRCTGTAPWCSMPHAAGRACARTCCPRRTTQPAGRRSRCPRHPCLASRQASLRRRGRRRAGGQGQGPGRASAARAGAAGGGAGGEGGRGLTSKPSGVFLPFRCAWSVRRCAQRVCVGEVGGGMWGAGARALQLLFGAGGGGAGSPLGLCTRQATLRW